MSGTNPDCPLPPNLTYPALLTCYGHHHANILSSYCRNLTSWPTSGDLEASTTFKEKHKQHDSQSRFHLRSTFTGQDCSSQAKGSRPGSFSPPAAPTGRGEGSGQGQEGWRAHASSRCRRGSSIPRQLVRSAQQRPGLLAPLKGSFNTHSVRLVSEKGLGGTSEGERGKAC